MKLKHIFKGSENFSTKIILALLTGESVTLTHIRDRSTNPGVTDAEVSLLKLVDELTNGTKVKINDTGTVVTFHPGTLVGGDVNFICSNERGLGYYLQAVLIISPFCKSPIELCLFGVTNNNIDPSVDLVMKNWFKVMTPFIGLAATDALKVEIIKRGVPPKGGGEIRFYSKPSRIISPVNLIMSSKVYRIRGIAWSCRVSPGTNQRMIIGAKEILNNFLSDVYFTKDHRKGEDCGASPGFGITLWAETKDGVIYSAEAMSEPEGSGVAPVIPDDLGRKAANLLVCEIYCGGCVDSSSQSLALLMMSAESGRNASQLLLSEPTQYTVGVLRLIHEFLGVKFDIRYEDQFIRQDEEVRKRLLGISETESAAAMKKKKRAASGINPCDITVGEKQDNELEPSSCIREPSLGALKVVATCFGSGLQHVSKSIR